MASIPSRRDAGIIVVTRSSDHNIRGEIFNIIYFSFYTNDLCRSDRQLADSCAIYVTRKASARFDVPGLFCVSTWHVGVNTWRGARIDRDQARLSFFVCIFL